MELCGRELAGNFAWNCNFHVNSGIFYMPQICDMGPTALLPFRRKACWGFFRPEKSLRLQRDLNPRTWVLKGSTLPVDHRSRLSDSYCQSFLWNITLKYNVLSLFVYVPDMFTWYTQSHPNHSWPWFPWITLWLSFVYIYIYYSSRGLLWKQNATWDSFIDCTGKVWCSSAKWSIGACWLICNTCNLV